MPPAVPCNEISGGGTIVTCSGNLSSGVDLSNGGGPFQILNAGSLTADIAPATGIDGILFTSNGAVELNVDSGAFAIRATNAEGIFAASNAGTVTIRSAADIVTTGSGASGIQASGQDDLLTIMSSGNISTSGNNAFGIAAGTVYGNVVVTSTGNIATAGTFAAGINVGTIGQSGIDVGHITIVSTGDIATSGTSAVGINAASAYGAIDITSLGDIATAGEDAVGIYAQTDGAAMVFSYGSIVTSSDRAAGIAVAGENGAVVISTSNIRTFGDNAPGITVLSDGDAGVVSSGNITTTGGTSDGIGVVSTSGMAAVVNSGRISATGLASAGIYAAGYTGALVMNYGTVVGGPCCAGVMMDSDSFNTLLNWGTITAGLADFAVDLMAPSNTVENFGTITGDVRLFDGSDPAGSFINHAGALLNSGQQLIAAYVVNEGTVSPGGDGTISQTIIGDPASTLHSQFTQLGSGTLAIDIDGASGTSDQVGVTGSAQLAGNVALHLTSVPLTAAQTFLILTADDGVTNDGLRLTASPALHATLTYPNANDVVLGIAVDFDVSGLNGNQRAIARDLGEIFLAGGGGVTPVLLGLLNTGDLAEYRSALDQLSPAIYSDAQIAALYSSLAFSNSLLSCKVSGTNTASIIREGQCLWAGASARFLDAGTTSQQIGFTEDAGLFTAGAQVALDDVWRLGAAAGYQSSTIDTATGATSSGALGQAGLAVKYNPGPLLLAGAIAGGAAHYDTRRPISFGGFTGVAEGDQDLGIFSGTLRAAYVLGSPSLYFKPSIDASLTHLELSGFTEAGGNGAALTANGHGQTVFSLTPLIETGTEWWLANGTLVRPLIRAGAVWYDNADLALTASFAEAPLGVAPFTIHTNVDDVMGVAGAGVDVISRSGAVLRFSYDGQFGETTQIHAVGIKGSAKF